MYKAKHIDICSGVTLHYIKTDKFKTDNLTFLFSSQLDAKWTSYRTLLIGVLMSGSEDMPTVKAINDRISHMYGANLSSLNSKRGDIQNTGVTMKYLNDYYTPDDESMLDRALGTVCSILFKPLVKDAAFDKKIFELEKKNLIDAIEAEINNKTVYARKKCLSVMCQDELYGINVDGDIGIIEKIDEKALFDFYCDFINTTPIDIYYVGMQDEDLLISSLKKQMSHLNIKPTGYKKFPIIYDVSNVKRVTESMEVIQGKLTMGFRTGIARESKDFAALTVFNAVYGQTPTSKLFKVVREKMSLCYYCRSQISETKGIMLISSGIECANKEKAEKEILNQLDEIKKGVISDEELALAKKFHINSLKGLFDSAGAIVTWHASELYVGAVIDRDEFMREIENVSKEDIIKIANGIKLDTVYYLKSNAEVDA